MEFEAGESIIPPEMYEAYHLSPATARPSDLHSSRATDQNGNFVGFNGDPVFSEGLMVEIDLTAQGPRYYLVPTNLRMQDQRNLNRGIPVIADEQTAQQIIQRLQLLNPHFAAQFKYHHSSHELELLH